MSESLYLKYRPKTFKEVMGHPEVIRSLKAALDKNTNQTFLFSGPSGLGKTTLARIAAEYLGCEHPQEIDAATFTGIDDMREITKSFAYRPLNEKVRVVILDECFVEGTRVGTPAGFKPIEELSVGDYVIGVSGPNKIKRVLKKTVSLTRIIKLRLPNGMLIFCSEDHPFLTNIGWVAARDMNGKSVLTTDGDTVQPQVQAMWDSIYEQGRWCSLLFDLLCQDLPRMSNKVLEHCKHLLPFLWQQSGCAQKDGTALIENPCSTQSWHGEESFREARNVGKVRSSFFRQNEKEQSNSDARRSGKGACCEGISRIAPYLERKAGGKWAGTHRGAIASAFFDWRNFRVSSKIGGRSLARALASVLQSGYWFSGTEACSRVGWGTALLWRRAKTGQDQNAQAEFVRVESLTFQERDSLERSNWISEKSKGFVTCYDLEVDGHPSYNVEGALVHNCHALSKSAWQSLLKSLEEPPEWLFWFLCTTDPAKVPQNIQTRCTGYALKPLPASQLIELLDDVAAKEDVLGDDLGIAIIRMCAREAQGSPRQALVNLGACLSARSKEEAATLLENAEAKPEAVELARLLVNGATWEQIKIILEQLGEQNPESVRHVVRGYVTKVILGAKKKPADNLFAILEAFSKPFASGDGISPLVLAIGTMMA